MYLSLCKAHHSLFLITQATLEEVEVVTGEENEVSSRIGQTSSALRLFHSLCSLYNNRRLRTRIQASSTNGV